MPYLKAWKIIKTYKLVFTLFLLFISLIVVLYISKLTRNKQYTVSKASGSGVPCEPKNLFACEFFERCASEFTTPTCEYDPDWRNKLNDEEKLEIRVALGSLGISFPNWLEQSPLNPPSNDIILLKPPEPSNVNFYRDSLAKIIHATYPYLSFQEREEILNELENAWSKRQTETFEYSLNGLMIAMDIVTLPETLGTVNALRQGAWNIIKNPRQLNNIVLKLRSIPEAIETLRTTKSPAALASILEIEDEPLFIVTANTAPESQTTLQLINITAKKTSGYSLFKKGYAAPITALTQRLVDTVKLARQTVVKAGGTINYMTPIEVARSLEDFKIITGIAKPGTVDLPHIGGFYSRVLGKIVINPLIIREPDLYRLLVHELIHEASHAKGFNIKLARNVGWGQNYTKILEAWTEYTAARITDGRLNVSYENRVKTLDNFFQDYVQRYLSVKGLPSTDFNKDWVWRYLHKPIYDYIFTDSKQIENLFDDIFPEGFKNKLINTFSNISQLPRQKEISEVRNNPTEFLSLLKKYFKLKEVNAAALRINCCSDWPDELDLKEPFLDALQTSQDLNILEWDAKSFEALINLEWLKNRLNENYKLTYSDIKELDDLEFKVAVEQIDKTKFVFLKGSVINLQDIPSDEFPSINEEEIQMANPTN